MELVRCRMCGGKPCDTLIIGNGRYYVECGKCGVQTGHHSTRELAFNAWNKLMGVTLDELRVIHEDSYKCGSCILKEEQKHCFVAGMLSGQERIEKVVHERRAKKDEKHKR